MRRWGDPAAPFIVLLHWTPLSGRMFAPLAAHLATRFHVLAPDLPGYGRSDARGDSLAASLETARALRPEARWHMFDGPCPVHLGEGVADYAAQIIAFAEGIG